MQGCSSFGSTILSGFLENLAVRMSWAGRSVPWLISHVWHRGQHVLLSSGIVE